MKHKPTVTRSHCSLFLHFYILRFPDMFFILWNITAQSALTDWTMFCFVVSVFVPVSVCLGLCILLYLGLNKKYVFREYENLWIDMLSVCSFLCVCMTEYECVHMCMCRYGLPHCGLDRIIITSSDEIFQVFSPCSPVCACVCNICHPWQHAPC